MANRWGKEANRDRYFFLLGSNITEYDNYSHEIRRCLIPGRKAMTNLDSVLKSRDITLLTKIYHQGYDFSISRSHVQMWELDCKEGWASKTRCFWTVVLEKTPEILDQQGYQTSQSYRKSNLNICWKEWCWSFHTLDTWCAEQTHWKRPWCWERSRARGEGGDRGWDGWMTSLTQWTWIWANSGR